MIKILIVCRYKSKLQNNIAPFIYEQAEALKKNNICIEYFLIDGNGIFGYLKELTHLKMKIKEFNPNLIHAHYGLSGLFANLQRKVPVITTYHGSDINNHKILFLSRLCMLLSKYNIFVSEKQKIIAHQDTKCVVIPCGVDVELFKPINKTKARAKLGFEFNDKIVLFAGAYDNKVKNSVLAKESIKQLKNVKLLELKDYSRQQVSLLMNAVDVGLMTSFNEGSPQFIKESMACNLPIVSTDVGDVKELISGAEGCFIVSYDASDLAKKIKMLISFDKKTNGRKSILELGLDSDTIAKKIIKVYEDVTTNKH